jgi:hypothetical protein
VIRVRSFRNDGVADAEFILLAGTGRPVSIGMTSTIAPPAHPDSISESCPPKVRFAVDSLLEGAVTSEPVSEARNSLLAGKIQGISSIRARRWG